MVDNMKEYTYLFVYSTSSFPLSAVVLFIIHSTSQLFVHHGGDRIFIRLSIRRTSIDFKQTVWSFISI